MLGKNVIIIAHAVLAACWLLRSFDGGKLHCVLLLSVMCHLHQEGYHLI